MKRKTLYGIIILLNIVLCAAILLFVRLVTDNGIRLNRKLDLGNKYLLSMDYEGAIKAFSEAIEIDEMNADAYIGRGDAYVSTGDYKNAWSDYETAQKLSGDNTILDEKIGQSEIRVTSSSGGLPNAAVTLSGDTHSYEFQTDGEGCLRQTLYPENYRLTVGKENYLPYEGELSAESGGTQITDIFMEPARIPFSFETMNAFVNGGYSSAIAYQPEGYALVDINKDSVPELVLSFSTGQDNFVNYEVFYYDEMDGQMKSAGQLTETNPNYPVYYSEPYPGLFTYYRTSGSKIDYVYEFDGTQMNWIFNSAWQRVSGSPYEREVFYEDPNGRVSKGIYPIEQYAAVYDEFAPPAHIRIKFS